MSLQCISPHVIAPTSESKKLEWYVPRKGERVRVVSWTCDCLDPVYELCTAGGLYFVRRIEASAVGESERLICRDAKELWADLLVGRVH